MNNKNLKNYLSKALIVTAISFGLSAHAAEEKLSIAMVDMPTLMEKSSAVAKIREQIDKKADEFKKDSLKKEEYFKKKAEELEKQKNALAKDAIEKKEQELEQEQMDFHKKVQENRAILEKGYNESMQKVITALNDIVKDEAKKSNVKLVLHKQHAIYSDDSMDITNTVLEALNKKLSTVDVKF